MTKLGYQNITYRLGNGYNGWPDEAPFDRIIVAAAAELPKALLEQLAPKGRMVIPVGPRIMQYLLLITKDGSDQIERHVISKVVFVEFINDFDS